MVIGLGSMVGAGVFVAFAPAAEAAGPLLWLGLLLALGVAYCNATSSARLAALYPQSGGTYVYGRERLGRFWGFLAGWAFVAGKLASCAAMALTVGTYLWPAAARPVAVLVVAAVTALNYVGVHKSAVATRIIVGLVLLVLTVVVVTAWAAPAASCTACAATGSGTLLGVLQAAGFLFFAFAGYARIATLGEEVRDPARTIPRAIPVALAITAAVYATVGLATSHALGVDGLADSTAPLADAVTAAGAEGLLPVVRAGAALAATGSLLGLVLGVSRTTFAMSRDGYLPRALDRVHPAYRVPHRAEVAVGVVVGLAVLAGDLRGAIGFSSVCVLTYYAIANASAWTLQRSLRARAVPALGLVGCTAVGLALPPSSVLAGALVLAAGVVLWLLRFRATPDVRP
ncbi:amino acid/polyamine/organocation transporter, APC superfamily [Pedococcus cremeus]|uniref:Amino acid/polyamine/organocation transporter, APC superfamily n=1 Tax=Pedococcus cremeus TaxID=587636 RepID=A0A1H9XTP2_9MICO|nr:amino acid/polyamine/organocation transporter, APC superfamily [Pedococcus cremeus]